ncbi:glycoside hydrolase family 76 protein [Polyplosphaeria fusca]|uniref:Mannan endo-1,6-alpha-mannosidase n=1 Tax=Polyplosphaeria fusca TaxID=682080 RepID=A0A9P4QFY2_9PLEO|nr:glycoside hydrolase family 76 protein [Polyplosphaeria fusca]
MHSIAFLSLAACAIVTTVGALDLDVKSTDSIKDATKAMVNAIIGGYNGQEAGFPAGLFGDSYYFWEAGAVWTAMIEYSHLTGDTQYDKLIAQAMNHQVGEYNAYMPANQTKNLANDDQSTWGLAAMTAAETGFKEKADDGEWIDRAKAVFDTQAQRWDDKTCDGGLRWQIFTFNNGYNYKNAISNGQFFLLAARLAKATGNDTFTEWAEKTYKWTQDVGFLTEDFAVYDGADSEMDCESVNHIQWSLSHAVFTEGAAVMYNLTNDDSWKDAVAGFVSHSSIFQDEDSSILFEVACETNGKCNTDQKAFKGLAARHYARAAVSAPEAAGNLSKVLEASAKAAAGACSGNGDDFGCSLQWNKDGEAEKTRDGGLSETLSALEAVQVLLFTEEGSTGNGNGNGTLPSAAQSGNAGPSPTNSGGPTEATGSASQVANSWSLSMGIALLALFVLQ